MMRSEQIKSILKINGASEASPDEHIRSILLNAHYTRAEVNDALSIIRNKTMINKHESDDVHKIFRSSTTLKPEEISNLLGIQVDVSTFQSSAILPESDTSKDSVFPTLLVGFLSIILAICGVVLYMFLNQLGFFFVSPEQLAQGQDLFAMFIKITIV